MNLLKLPVLIFLLSIKTNLAESPPKFTSVCDRTPQIRNVIVAELGIPCGNITEANLTKIKKLKLGSMGIEELRPGDFDGFGHLEELDLSSNMLRTIPEFSQELSSLQILELDSNYIGELPSRRVFERMPNLTSLNISYNEMSATVSSHLEPLTRLKNFYAYRNKFEVIPGGLEKLMELETINLSFNEISKIHGGTFEKLSQLVTLNLSSNKLETIFDGPVNLTNLKELNLGYNRISEIRVGSFDKLSKLINLRLDHNRLETVFDNLANLASLETLNLNNNWLREFPTLSYFPRLIWLRLDSNRISAIPKSGSVPRSLKGLILSGNWITSIPNWLGYSYQFERFTYDAACIGLMRSLLKI